MRTLLASFALVALAAAQASAKTCYCDTDYDGYAADNAESATANSDGSCPTSGLPLRNKSCTTQYVERRGDCQASDAASHPRAHEKKSDFIDNDCDGSVDEPQVEYSLVNPADFDPVVLHQITLQINDLTTAFNMVYSPSVVGYKMTITALDGTNVDGSGSSSTETLPASGPQTFGWSFDPSTWKVKVLSYYVAKHLKPHHIYKVQVQFYQNSTAMGPISNAYYTESGGNAADPTGDKQAAREDIVLLAFQQVGESAYGEVGYAGSDPDGWRYAHQPDGTVGSVDWENGWCDMFWGWVAYNAVPSDFLLDLGLNNQRKGFVDPHDENSGDPWGDGVHHTDASYYDDGMGTAGSFYYDSTSSNPANGNIGDFLLAEGHAGMYLATHSTTGNIITVEGNYNDEVIVNEGGRANVWPPPSSRNFWVGIGKLNKFELGL